MKHMVKGGSGFTIVEVAVVIVIIGILTTLVTVSYRAIQQDSDRSAIEGDLRQAAMKLESHKADAGSYPATAAAVDNGKGLPKSDSERVFNYRKIDNNNFCISMTSTIYTTELHITTQGGTQGTQVKNGGCL